MVPPDWSNTSAGWAPMETIRSGSVIPCLSVSAGPQPGLSLAPTHFPEAGGKSQDREAQKKVFSHVIGSPDGRRA
jgi:hypothetical protein